MTPKWRVWFAKNDSALPWRIQPFEAPPDVQPLFCTSVEFQYGVTEVAPEREGKQPPQGVIVCSGKVFLNGTRAIIS